MSNSSESGHGFLWNRFHQHESCHKSHTHVNSSWSFRSIFGSARVPDCKKESDSSSQKKAEKVEIQSQDSTDGGYKDATPLSESLTRELKQTLEGKSVDLPLSRSHSMHIQSVCCSSEVCQASEVDGGTGDLKRGGSMRCRKSQQQYNQMGNSQQSLTTKEGEDTSWQFLRAPPDGMSESKATAPAESHTTSHSHSDQGYMSGTCTAEQSPESPRQEPKQAISVTIAPPVQLDACHHDRRLTVSTPDHLYPDPSEETMDGCHNNMLTRSDSDISVLLPKQDDHDGNKVPATYVAIKGEMVRTNSPLSHPNLMYEKNTMSSSIQQSGAGGGLVTESGLYCGGTNRDIWEVRCVDHPPQPQPSSSSRRSFSTKSYSSSEGSNGDGSSSGSLQSESYSLEMEPRAIQLSAHRRPIHLRHHTKRIRCEEVL
jgi:hypothetical protein